MRPNDFCRLWKNHIEGLRPQTTKRGQMVFAGLGKLHGRLEVLNHIWRPEAQSHKRRPNDFSGPWKNHMGGLRPHKMRPNDFCRLWKNHFEGLRPQTTKRGQMVFAGLGKLHGRLEVLNHIWRPEAQNHKRRPNDFSGPWKNHLGGLRPHKMRPNDFCRLWKNHFEGLRPQTTKRGQMVFEGLGKLHGRLEVVNHIWRPEAQKHKRRPNDFSGPWKNHLGGLRPHKMRPHDFCRLWKNHFEGLRPQTTKRGQMMLAGLGKLHGRLEVFNRK